MTVWITLAGYLKVRESLQLGRQVTHFDTEWMFACSYIWRGREIWTFTDMMHNINRNLKKKSQYC